MHNNTAQNTRNLITENKIKLLEWMEREVQVELKMVLWRFLQLTERRNRQSNDCFEFISKLDDVWSIFGVLEGVAAGRLLMLKLQCILKDEWEQQVKVWNMKCNFTLNLYRINF